jgi:RNA 2',3'-cyclic 3'-phosphodiesterase
MLITDNDDRSRQGTLWRADQRQATGSILPASSVFFALYPDPHTARRLGRLAWYLRHKHRLNGRPLADRRLHISLCNISDHAWPTSKAAAAIGEAMATITMPPFLVAFNEATSFNGGHKPPVVLVGSDGVAGLMLFQRELVAALGNTGIGRRKPRPYNPHVTLLYDERRIPDQPIEPISWMVREFVLVCSLQGQGRHIPLARWPLRGG